MSEAIYLLIGNSQDNTLQWYDPARAEDDRIQSGSLHDLVAGLDERPVIALVDSSCLRLSSVALPARNQAQLRRAVPYALEESLAGDVDDFHFALGRTQGEQTPVAVIQREMINHWKDQFDQEGITLLFMMPDLLSVPYQPRCWSVLGVDERLLFRTGEYSGFIADRETPGFMLETALQGTPENQRPEALFLYGDASMSHPLRSSAEEQGLEVLAGSNGEQPALALMASEATGGPCINLLQGEFATTPSLQERVRPWRPAIVAATLWLAFTVGAELFDYWRLQSENQQLQQRISSLYRKALPDSRMVNPKVQMERTLESLKRKLDGGEGVLQLLAVAGVPLSEETGVEVMGISYHDSRLDMDLAADNLQEIEEIRKAVAENERLVVALHSASTRNNRARGKITLKVKDQ